MLYKKYVKLGLKDVQKFVQAANECDFDINISGSNTGRYIVDAKSIVGVMGLDLNNKVCVEYDGYNEKFEAMLKRLEEAC